MGDHDSRGSGDPRRHLRRAAGHHRRDFRARYGHDYDIHIFDDRGAAPACRQLRQVNHELPWWQRRWRSPTVTASKLLDRVHQIDATSRRIVLLAGRLPTNLPAAAWPARRGPVRHVAGHSQGTARRGVLRGDRGAALRLGWTTNAIEVDGVQVVAPLKMPEVARDHRLPSADGHPTPALSHRLGELGQRVIAAVGPGAQFPVRTPSKKGADSDDIDPDHILGNPTLAADGGEDVRLGHRPGQIVPTSSSSAWSGGPRRGGVRRLRGRPPSSSSPRPSAARREQRR